MNWWRWFLNIICTRIFRRNPRPIVQVIPPVWTHAPRTGNNATPNPPHQNPMAGAWQRIYDMNDRAEDRYAFRRVGVDGTVDATIEEWARENDEYVARTHHTKVVTCSGEIVLADQLHGVCWCGG